MSQVAVIAQGSELFDITPSDVDTFKQCILYVGGEGDLEIVGANGGTVVLKNASGLIPIQVTQVKDSLTSATDIVGIR